LRGLFVSEKSINSKKAGPRAQTHLHNVLKPHPEGVFKSERVLADIPVILQAKEMAVRKNECERLSSWTIQHKGAHQHLLDVTQDHDSTLRSV
jgi:hypothetical protein